MAGTFEGKGSYCARLHVAEVEGNLHRKGGVVRNKAGSAEQQPRGGLDELQGANGDQELPV